ncbi:fungal-specific transcription factor domain-domain-containing protein [Microdochium bolleyi]|uniref:Fungal-specific transcription factor domain-domain-containing protein n=1 Tax=Microdochium bolleyi TaxID=196109 RepID=A0A136IX76_9PEZI|nr:fungal-specific transcription factor domain-domain-containing protein [Microdochium bolleyi]
MSDSQEEYFHHLYPLPAFAFLHKPTVVQRCRDGTINEQLKLAICAITALHLQRSSLSHDLWILQAENSILQHIGQPSIFHLQSLFLIVRYRIESGGFPKAFMLAGLAARTAVALRLNYERRDLSYVAQEARRRLYWSLYLLDDYFCVGLREFELCPEETIHLQLPCSEELFEAGGHKLTGFLHPDSSDEREPTGLHASYLRVTAARRANMRFIRRVGLGEESPTTLRNSIQTLEQNLTLIHAGMGELGTYSLATLTSTKWQAEYLMLHISWHQCHCDLYRSFIDSYSEAAPIAVLEGLHPQDRAALQRKCVDHAQTIIRILSDFSQHGDGQCQLERDIAVCAFEAARIVMFDCRRTGLAAMMEEALRKANLCIDLITRHFFFSASTRPLWIEFKRLIDSYTVRKALQEREQEEVTNAESQPPSPRSTRLSQIATARQKLSVQSLLRQSDFVDDSDDIVGPYGPVAPVLPPGVGITTHSSTAKRKPSTPSFQPSRVPAPPRSVSDNANNFAPVVDTGMTDTPAVLGLPTGSTGFLPLGVGSMMEHPAAASVPLDAGPSSAAAAATPGATTLPVAMDTSVIPPAVPGFDPGFVFNPWMGFSGNEDLRAYYGLAVGANEEY